MGGETTSENDGSSVCKPWSDYANGKARVLMGMSGLQNIARKHARRQAPHGLWRAMATRLVVPAVTVAPTAEILTATKSVPQKARRATRRQSTASQAPQLSMQRSPPLVSLAMAPKMTWAVRPATAAVSARAGVPRTSTTKRITSTKAAASLVMAITTNTPAAVRTTSIATTAASARANDAPSAYVRVLVLSQTVLSASPRWRSGSITRLSCMKYARH